MNDIDNHSVTNDASRGRMLLKLAVFIAVVTTVGFFYYSYADALTLSALAEKESALRDFQAQNPVLVFAVAFMIYVTVTGLSLPGAAALSLVFGWFFGFWRTVLLVSFASTTGATLAFLLSRYLFRDIIQTKFAVRLESINASLRREGAFYLFTLRLIPAVPFFVINLVMGLTPMRVTTYWWVSQLGMLPGTIVYVYAGSQFPDLKTLAEKGASGILSPQLLAAFILLGLFPLIIRKIMQRWLPDKAM